MSSLSKLQPEQDRMEAWVRDHGLAVRGYVFALVRRYDVADDLVQEVYRRAWQARDRYAENGTARAYLLRIADRLVWDHGRRARREITLGDDDWRDLEPVETQDEPAGRLLQSESQHTLQQALDGLTHLQRRVLLLRFYGDMSFTEIADTLQCPLSTALSHCRRGLLALRRVITQDEP